MSSTEHGGCNTVGSDEGPHEHERADHDREDDGDQGAGHPEVAAYLDEIAHCYAAHDLVADPLPADADEFFERRVVPYPEAVRMALDGEITESVSKVTILQYAARTMER